MKALNWKTVGDNAIRIFSAVAVLPLALLISAHAPRGILPLLAAWGGGLVLALLVYKLAGAQLALYRSIRGVCGKFRLVIVSVICSVLLLAFCALAYGMVLLNVPVFLGGTATVVVCVVAECGTVSWKKAARSDPKQEAGRNEGVDDSFVSGKFIIDRDLLPLSTYLLMIVISAAVFLMWSLEAYGLWEAEEYSWVEIVAFAPVALLAVVWVVAFVTTLLSPKREDESGRAFLARAIPGAAMLMGAVGYAEYRVWGQAYEEHGVLGVVNYALAMALLGIAFVGLMLDSVGKSREDKRDAWLRILLMLYAFLWLFAEENIVKSYPNGEWLHAPEFFLFVAAMAVVIIVSLAALSERIHKGRMPVWEKDLFSYFIISVVFVFLGCLFGSPRGDSDAAIQCGDSDAVIQCAGSGAVIRCACANQALGGSAFLSNGAVQILLGVVTVEYFIAFWAALRDEQKTSLGKKLQQRMYL